MPGKHMHNKHDCIHQSNPLAALASADLQQVCTEPNFAPLPQHMTRLHCASHADMVVQALSWRSRARRIQLVAHAHWHPVKSPQISTNVCTAVAVDGSAQQAFVLRNRLAAGVHGQRGLAGLQRLRQPLHLEEAQDAARQSAPMERLQLDGPVRSLQHQMCI